VGLSNSWTSDLSFEISDLLIYVVTYIGGFRISVASCAGYSQSPPIGAAAAGHAIQYVTRRTGVSSRSYTLHVFRPIALWRRRPIRKRAKWWNAWYFNAKWAPKCRTFNTTIRLTM